MMRMVVDLPAPLGPRNPVTRPGVAVNETSSTAVNVAVGLRDRLDGDHRTEPIVMATLPRTLPDSRYRIASAASAIG